MTSLRSEAKGTVSMLIWTEFLLFGSHDALALDYLLVYARISFPLLQFLPLLISFQVYALLQSSLNLKSIISPWNS